MQDPLVKQTKKQKFKGTPLSKDQVDKAKEMIKETHPLSETPVSQVFPLLTPILKCFDRKKQVNEQPLLDAENQKAKNKKAYKLSEEEQGDPYNVLGFGMVAYRDLLLTLICLFAFLSVVMAPTIYFYTNGGGIQNPTSSYDAYTIGNMGYSSSQCQTVPVDLLKIPMMCSYGVVSKIFHIGVNPAGVVSKYSCASITTDAAQTTCNSALSQTFISTLNETVMSGNGSSNYEQTYTLSELFTNVSTTDVSCTNSSAYLYIQYTCAQTVETLVEKHRQASIVSCLGVFLVCVYIITIYWFKRASKHIQINWDLQTITPGDYTVQYEITDKAYEWFLENVFPADKAQGKSSGESLKNYVKSQLESILTDKLNQMKSNGNLAPNIKINDVKIADIAFAFNNAELINLLRVRGAHIMNQRYDAMREIEAKISELKDQKFKELVKPCDAFITFEEEDGGIIAQEFEPKFTFSGKKLPTDNEFMGDELFLVESTEPTNIIWENRYFTSADYMKKTLIAFAIIAFLLMTSFLVMFICKMFAIQKGNMYPDVDCNQIDSIYDSTTLLENYAYREYQAYYNSPDGQAQPFSGVLQCFCGDVSAATGSMSLLTHEVNGVTICKDYLYDTYIILLFGNSVSYMIVAINFILRVFIIKLILYIGKDTESEQTRLITNGVFITQFFNTALLLLSVNANLEEQGSFVGKIFSRGESDFDQSWFQDIGKTLVGAMLFNIYWPILEFFIYLGMRNGFRLLDRSFGCSEYKTKKTTIENYVNVYSGPVFFIHYKYSSILNITFVTMMYGLGLPILFPIAAASFFALYVMEKIMIYYSYRQPPMYDEKLNNNVLALMTYAPLLFLSFGYWMISNKQLVGNQLKSYDYTTDTLQTGHIWTQVFTSAAYAGTQAGMPLLITFWVFLFGTIFRGPIYKWITAKVEFFRIGMFEIDEDLDNYFKSIDDNDRNWSIKEEEYFRAMKLKVLNEETFDKLKSNVSNEAVIKGVHCYDILANPSYVKSFQYMSPAMDNRAEYIIDDDEDEDNDNAQSDLVKMILNLAFLTEENAKSFSFNKSAYANIGGGKSNKIN